MSQLDLLLRKIMNGDFTDEERLALLESAKECGERQKLIEKTRNAGEVNVDEISRVLELAIQKLADLNNSLQIILKNMQGMLTEAAGDLPKSIH